VFNIILETKSSVVLIGARGGIGTALSQHFENKQFKVLGNNSSDLDLSSKKQVTDWLNRFREPTPEILICNAGINIPNLIRDQSEEEFRKILEVNFMSYVSIIKFFAERMTINNYGKIIVISSAYARRFRNGRSAYSASKSALESFAKTAAIEFAKSNVLINCVAPGFLSTEMTFNNNDKTKIAAICENIPMGRLGEVEEILGTIDFLSSRKNTYITGQTINVDGGYSIV
jgi:3-oxoacyl-[acyl-carrier protein] reductase